MTNSDSPAVPFEVAMPPEVNPPLPSSTRPWRPIAIAWICVLFSLLPAGIMYALNFKRLGQPEKTKPALLFVLIASGIYYSAAIATFLLMEANPESARHDASVRLWFFIINMGLAWHFYLRQQPLFLARLRQGARKAPLFVPLLLSCLWLAVYGGGFYGFAYFQELRDVKKFEAAVLLMDGDQYREAEAIFDTYKRKYPDDTGAHWNLAVIYARTERIALAKEELEALLWKEPDHQEAKEFLQELDTY